MTGLGTILNSAGIVFGGIVGRFAGKFLKPQQQDALNKACGVSILFIAIAGAMEGMLKIEGNEISSGKSMLVVLCLALGTLMGEIIGVALMFGIFALLGRFDRTVLLGGIAAISLVVGGIVNLRENQPVRRGEEKGYFELAGSTITLLFQKGRIKIFRAFIVLPAHHNAGNTGVFGAFQCEHTGLGGHHQRDLAAGNFTPGFRIQNGLQVRAAAGDQDRDVQHSSTPSPSAISPRMYASSP